MRTFLTTTIMATMLLGLMSTSGCMVPKADYDALSAHNMRLLDQVADLRDELAQIENERNELQRRLDSGGNPEQVALLQNALRDLDAEFDILVAKYQALVNRSGAGPLPGTVNLALEQLAAQHSGMVEFLPDLGMIKFRADLTFPKGQDALQPAAASALRELASIVGSAEVSGFNVYVAGHTDDIPIKKPETLKRHPNNWYLSVHRAVMVQEALVKAGVSPDRLAVMGFGEYHPTAANAPGKKGNPANRRVEIWIVPPQQFLTGAP